MPPPAKTRRPQCTVFATVHVTARRQYTCAIASRRQKPIKHRDTPLARFSSVHHPVYAGQFYRQFNAPRFQFHHHSAIPSPPSRYPHRLYMPEEKLPANAIVAAETMLSFAPAPIFTANWDHHRPTVSSPLSSSPLRATAAPDTQDDDDEDYASSLRQTQSSPIQGPKFRYAARAARANPVMRRREDVQQQRRATFLRSVRDKAEDKAWQRRDIEGQFLKTNWIADMDRLSRDAPEFSEADIEDASSFQPMLPMADTGDEDMNDDAIHGSDDMVDEYAEDAELEAMFASYQQQQQPPRSPATRPISPSLSDDEYDDIFEELLSAKDIDLAMQTQRQTEAADQMDME